jgi:hypothetical protein
MIRRVLSSRPVLVPLFLGFAVLSIENSLFRDNVNPFFQFETSLRGIANFERCLNFDLQSLNLYSQRTSVLGRWIQRSQNMWTRFLACYSVRNWFYLTLQRRVQVLRCRWSRLIWVNSTENSIGKNLSGTEARSMHDQYRSATPW